jgi:ABC-type nickel/cobalt efflux system permease component RcnA
VLIVISLGSWCCVRKLHLRKPDRKRSKERKKKKTDIQKTHAAEEETKEKLELSGKDERGELHGDHKPHELERREIYEMEHRTEMSA